MGHYPTSVHAAADTHLRSELTKWVTERRRPLRLQGCECLEDFCEVGDLAINISNWTVTWRSQHLDCTVSEVKIILAFAERPGVCLSYREVYDAVRGPGFHVGDGLNGHRNAARTHIKRIRNKLRSIDPAFDRIETRMGIGYVWRTAAVQ